jgi:hypothetical protein
VPLKFSYFNPFAFRCMRVDYVEDADCIT